MKRSSPFSNLFFSSSVFSLLLLLISDPEICRFNMTFQNPLFSFREKSELVENFIEVFRLGKYCDDVHVPD